MTLPQQSIHKWLLFLKNVRFLLIISSYCLKHNQLTIRLIIKPFAFDRQEQMKQQLKKFRGQTISTSLGEIQLKQYYQHEHCEYDQVYFITNRDFLLCKIYNIIGQSSQQRYHRQSQIYGSEDYPNMAKCVSKSKINVKKINYAMILLDEMPKNSTLNQINNTLSSNQLLKLAKTSLQLIKQLKDRNQVFLNFRPQNIVLNTKKNFVIMNPQFVCSKGSHSQVQAVNELFFNNVQKYFKYNSPQVLDNYTYYPIDYKSDLFSLGCIFYEIIFDRYPFESKFANINIIYEKQSGFFGQFIDQLFKPYKERADVQNLIHFIDTELQKNPTELKKTKSSLNLPAKSTNYVHSFLDDISLVFNKYTKQTEGAYMNFTEDNERLPQPKYLNFILKKLLKNPNKISKLQSIMSRHVKATEYGKRKSFMLKNLVLIFFLIRKNITLMIGEWRQNISEIRQLLLQKLECLQFCDLLMRKIQIQQELNCIMRGNFYIEDARQFKSLNLSHLGNMMKYLELAISYANKLTSYKEDESLFHFVLEVVCDQIYDLISMIIFSVICIRKDNQLELRKDNLADVGNFEKSISTVLKKINSLSNKISSHAIYSIEASYYNYKEDIQLKQNPQYTSLEHFIKYCNCYKGLTMPGISNFLEIGQSETRGDFSSFDGNIQKQKQSATITKKILRGELSSSEDEPEQSNQITYQGTIISKVKEGQKKIETISQNTFSENKSFALQNLKKKQQIEKQIEKQIKKQSEQQVEKQKAGPRLVNKSLENQQIISKNQKISFADFNHFFVSDDNKPSIQDKNQVSIFRFNKNVRKCSKDLFQDFSLFQQKQGKKPSSATGHSKTLQNHKKQDTLNWMDFNEPPKKTSKNQKLEIKVDPSILKQDIFSYDWLKKCEQNPFGIFVQINQDQTKSHQKLLESKQTSYPTQVTEAIASLKLKELKELILKNKDVVIEFAKLAFEKIIGHGGAGQVYLGKYDNQLVAIKKVKIKQNPNALKEFERELVTYIKIKKNPFLVSLVGLSKSGEDFYLLTEYCNGGSLFDLLHKNATRIFLNWKTKLSLILQVAKGMKALHDMKPPIIHRDLKSLNVFVSSQNNQWVGKVADFGLSRSPQGDMMTMALGTLHWMAPQLLQNKQYSLKVDVYSFAIVMWEICARKTPYYDLSNPMAIMKYVTIDKKRPNMNVIDTNCPQKLLQLIRLCWDEDPNKRPYFNEIIQILGQIESSIPSQ